MPEIVSILILTLIVTLFSSILLTGSVVAAYTFVRFVALVREHGREAIWIWVEDTNFFSLKALPFASSNNGLDGSERPEEWFEKSLPGSADESDHETPGGLAVEVKHEDSNFEPSPNHTLVSQEIKVEVS